MKLPVVKTSLTVTIYFAIYLFVLPFFVLIATVGIGRSPNPYGGISLRFGTSGGWTGLIANTCSKAHV
jgi:hypothetical protein